MRLDDRKVEACGRRAMGGVQRRGFTLIEIMIVVGVIIILASLTIVIGVAVKAKSLRSQTAVELKAIEGIMDDYLKTNANIPVNDPRMQLLDPDVPQSPTNPKVDTTLWVQAVRSMDNKKGTLNQLPGANTPNILDSYGTPIRYIPPDPATKRPGVFMSLGADRETAAPENPNAQRKKTRDDDVYSSVAF